MSNIGPVEVIVLLLALAFWLVLSHLVAKYTEGKGQNYWLFLILGLATSFIVSWVLAAILGQNRRSIG